MNEVKRPDTLAILARANDSWRWSGVHLDDSADAVVTNFRKDVEELCDYIAYLEDHHNDLPRHRLLAFADELCLDVHKRVQSLGKKLYDLLAEARVLP